VEVVGIGGGYGTGMEGGGGKGGAMMVGVLVGLLVGDDGGYRNWEIHGRCCSRMIC